MQHTTIAVDLAKSVFQVAISHKPGRVDEENRLGRARLLPCFATQPAATVLLEACGLAYHWGRALTQLGHTVRLLPPHESRRRAMRTSMRRRSSPRPSKPRHETVAGPGNPSTMPSSKPSMQRFDASPYRNTGSPASRTRRGSLRQGGTTITNVRPHSSLGQQTQAKCGSGGDATSTRQRLRNLQP